jgi:acyl-CoA thioester hydrolase
MAVGEMIETYRGAVAAWECDAFGHLNIAHYPARFVAASADLLERVAPGASWRTAALDVQYLRELRAAVGIVIRSFILAATDSEILVAHEALSLEGERTTLAEHRLARDVPPRGAGAIPAGELPWTRFAAIELPPGDGPIPTGRDRVDGGVTPSFYVHRFSDACLFAIEALGMSESYRREANRGFATFETRLALESPGPASGSGIVVTSGIVAIGGSSLRLLHRMRAAEGGRLLAQFYQAGVHFDLAARRAAPWPPEFRDNAETLRYDAQ